MESWWALPPLSCILKPALWRRFVVIPGPYCIWWLTLIAHAFIKRVSYWRQEATTSLSAFAMISCSGLVSVSTLLHYEWPQYLNPILQRVLWLCWARCNFRAWARACLLSEPRPYGAEKHHVGRGQCYRIYPTAATRPPLTFTTDINYRHRPFGDILPSGTLAQKKQNFNILPCLNTSVIYPNLY